MLRQSLLQQQPFEASFIQDNRSLLLDIVRENHLLYHMEKRDRPNTIIRVLVNLHKLGATQEQLEAAYKACKRDAEYIHIPKVSSINEKNWEEYLGTSSLYGDYLVFFDKQLSVLGLDETLNRYFYSVEMSMGSQLQPLVQLAFGIEHNLPEIITQALAYYASSYLDASNILDYCQEYKGDVSTAVPNTQLSNTILFDLIRADQRFDGKIEGNNTFQSAVKLLLKSKSDLIKTYMAAWTSSPQTPSQRLDALIYTAATLAKVASRQQSAHVDLDWFLAGGQLMDSALAIKRIIRPDHLENWVNLQFLSTLCTFVVQGRPMNVSDNSTLFTHPDVCVSTVIQNSFDDPKLILALTSAMDAQTLYPELEPICMDTINTLAQFSTDGTWVKGGLGWAH